MEEEWWTSSAVADRLYLEMCLHDDNGQNNDHKYSTQAIRYASRRAIVKQRREFTDVIRVYIRNFSAPLNEQILKLSSDLESINEVITNAVFKIMKSMAPQIYYEFIQNEPLRWILIDGEGSCKGDDSVIAERIATPEAQTEEDTTIIQLLTKSILLDNVFKTTTDNGQLYCYNGRIYIPDQDWVIKEQCRLILPEVTTHQIHEVINYIKDSTYIDRSEFDGNPDVINLRNGLLNIHTLEFRTHSPDEYFLYQLPIHYEPEAKCPNILRFLGQVLNPRDVFTVLEIAGYCLYRSAKYEKAVLCVGKGSNGKSTFLKIIEQLLGSQNVSHVSLQDLAGDRFASAGLYGKLVIHILNSLEKRYSGFHMVSS